MRTAHAAGSAGIVPRARKHSCPMHASGAGLLRRRRRRRMLLHVELRLLNSRECARGISRENNQRFTIDSKKDFTIDSKKEPPTGSLK
jgi:hypothetical protein